MKSPLASRAVSGLKPSASGLLVATLIAMALGGCKTVEEPGAHVAGWTLVDPAQRHPIMVAQQPATMSLRVPRGSQGLSQGQIDQVSGFLSRYRGTDWGNSKLVIAVPSGSPNETSAVRALADLRRIINQYGFADSAVAVEPYREGRDGSAPIRIAYLRYVAEPPICGRWTENLADDRRNLPFSNFGCAQQHNLAAQVANPADLLGPRTMDPADTERRMIMYDKYRQGKPTGAEKGNEEHVQVKGAN